MGNKHKYYDVIVAWANGEKIQVRVNDDYYEGSVENTFEDYFNVDGVTPDFDSDEWEWRIKPKTTVKRYRMALFSITKGKHSVSAFDITNSTVDNPAEYNIQGFIRWVSDIVEVEIEV